MKTQQMKHFIILIIGIIGFSIVVNAQQTVIEKTKTDNGLILEKTLDLELRVLKETYFDESGRILEYYNFNPLTGKIEGAFNNGIVEGTMHDGLITSDNYIHFITPKYNNTSSKALLIKGKIQSGKLNGKYNIYQREYKIQYSYDQYETILNTYISGKYTKTYSAFVDKNNFTEKIVGFINFEEGKYETFEFTFNNIRYNSKYLNGLIFSFAKYDLIDNSYIDSISISGKLYLKDRKYYKNEYPEIISQLDSLRKGIYATCEKITNNNITYKKSIQNILNIDPLNNSYEFINRAFNYGVNEHDYTWRWISYLKEDYSRIYLIPLSGGYTKQIGIDNYDGYNTPVPIPSIFELISISECTSQNITRGGNSLFKIPFFEYTFDLNTLLLKYGSQKGYSIYFSQIQNMDENNLNGIKQLYPDASSISIGRYSDIENYPNK